MVWKDISIGLLIGFGTHFTIILSECPILLSPIPFFGLPFFILLIYTFTRKILDPKYAPFTRAICKSKSTSNAWLELSDWLTRTAPFSMANFMPSAEILSNLAFAPKSAPFFPLLSHNHSSHRLNARPSPLSACTRQCTRQRNPARLPFSCHNLLQSHPRHHHPGNADL